jgi:23S rRNA pseudouridine1911/1915/1917 synthase
MKPTVLFEDNHLLIVNKPAGWLTQPNGLGQESLEEFCKNWIKIKYQKPGNVFLMAVHRLDKPASGIVLFAKTSKALSRLNESMRNKKMKKVYYALIEGIPQVSEATLEHYLLHGDFQAVVVQAHIPEAKLARLHYRVLKEHGIQALIEIDLDTGRYHQIRAQLAAMGHPIVGDAKYGNQRMYIEGGIALHHGHFEFPHPIQDKCVSIDSPALFNL